MMSSNNLPVVVPTPDVVEPTILVSVNVNLIDKNVAQDRRLFSEGWKNVELTVAEFAEAINLGWAYCAQLKGPRKADNFKRCNLLSVDMDNGRPIEDALSDPFVAKHLTVLYRTQRHTDTHHRYRLVFRTERVITSARDFAAALLGLSLKLCGDRSATDRVRIFFGSSNCDPDMRDGLIPDEQLDKLIEDGRKASQRSTRGPSSGTATAVARKSIDLDAMVRPAEGDEVAFRSLSVGTRLHCPFHYDRDPSAFVCQSFNAEVKGIHCSTCGQTYWPPNSLPPRYDFFSFEKTAREAQRFFEQNEDPEGLLKFTVVDRSVREGLYKSNISIVNDRYLSVSELKPGITLIKSPKGTGKTEVMSHLLENSASTVLIGHRVALIGQSCKRLGLSNYLDFTGPIFEKKLGICLDSLHRLKTRQVVNSKPVTKFILFQTVVIDESEQVLSHFLSDTMNRPNRRDIFLIFRRLLREAKYIVALDADLSWLTFETLTKLAD